MRPPSLMRGRSFCVRKKTPLKWTLNRLSMNAGQFSSPMPSVCRSRDAWHLPSCLCDFRYNHPVRRSERTAGFSRPRALRTSSAVRVSPNHLWIASSACAWEARKIQRKWMIAIRLHPLSRVPAKSVSSAVTPTKTMDEHSFSGNGTFLAFAAVLRINTLGALQAGWFDSRRLHQYLV
jgi:hypothetical protein